MWPSPYPVQTISSHVPFFFSLRPLFLWPFSTSVRNEWWIFHEKKTKKTHELHIDIATRQYGLAAFTLLAGTNRMHWWFCKRSGPLREEKYLEVHQPKIEPPELKRGGPSSNWNVSEVFVHVILHPRGWWNTLFFVFFWQIYQSLPYRLDTTCSTEAARGYLAAVCVVLKSHR